MTTRIFEIPASNWDSLVARIEKLARRGKKCDATTLPRLEIIHEQDKPYMEDGITYYCRYIYASLDGSAPTIDGWELIAIIDHTTDSDIGNLIRNVPGKECPLHFRDSKPVCEHCGITRRRNETFVLFNGSTYKQVGRNCLADFCRSETFADQLCGYAEYLASVDELASASEYDNDGMSGGVPRIPTEGLLACTVRAIRIHGWMSATKAAELYNATPTSSIVRNRFFDKKFFDYMDVDMVDAWKDESKDASDLEYAERALAWIRDQRDQRDSMQDYMYNLLVACSQETIEPKQFGLVCSLIATYNRAMGEIEIRKAKAASNHFGTVKVRATWTAVITGIRSFDSMYGTKYLVSFIVDGCNQGIWWSSTDATEGYAIGDEIKITGSVKNHGEYRGTKQTELTRCKIAKAMA